MWECEMCLKGALKCLNSSFSWFWVTLAALTAPAAAGRGAPKLFDMALLSTGYYTAMCYEFLLASREQHWQPLTDAVAMGVLCEAADALVFGITQERAHCVLTHKAHPTVMGSQNTFIKVWKKGHINIYIQRAHTSLGCEEFQNLLSALGASVWALGLFSAVGGTVAQAQNKHVHHKFKLSVVEFPSHKNITCSHSAINRSWTKLLKMTVIESHERWMEFKWKICSSVLRARFSGVHIQSSPLRLVRWHISTWDLNLGFSLPIIIRGILFQHQSRDLPFFSCG